MTASTSWEDMVTVGEVARSHGRWGEVIINPMTDFPNRFHDLKRVFVEGDDGEVAPLQVESVREQRGRPVLKFKGISGIGEAKRLAGRELRIPESELVALPEGSLFHFQVVGCRVRDRRSGYLGVVEDVLETGGTDVLVVRDSSGNERLIPLCKDICQVIDIQKGQIEIDAPDGLVSLNAR